MRQGERVGLPLNLKSCDTLHVIFLLITLLDSLPSTFLAPFVASHDTY